MTTRHPEASEPHRARGVHWRPSQVRADGDIGLDELLTAHHEAAAFFAARVWDSWVPAYLQERGLAAALDLPWAAGHAPRSWTGLLDHLRERGHDDAALVASGLATRARTGRLIDRFRDRMMLTLRAPDGEAMAFVGRARPGADEERVPRYLNSPTTPLYRKGEHLFGLLEAADALAQGATPVLVEGPMDAVVVSSGTRGRCAGLAVCGTALTAAQADILAEIAQRTQKPIVVATDADPAGRASAAAAYEQLSPRGTELLGASLPEGSDPAAVLRELGPAALTASLTERVVPLVDLVVDHRIDGWSGHLQWVEGRVGAFRDVAPLLAALPPRDAARQAQRVSRRIGIDLQLVQREVAQRLPPPAKARTTQGIRGR